MSQATTPSVHPLLRCVQTVADALDGAAGYDPAATAPVALLLALAVTRFDECGDVTPG